MWRRKAWIRKMELEVTFHEIEKHVKNNVTI